MNERLDLKRIHSRVMAARGGLLLAAKILEHERVTDRVARVVVSFSQPDASRDDMRQSLQRVLGGQASAVENSFMELCSDQPIYVGYVAHNPEVREFTTEQQAALAERKGPLRVVAKNLLLDETDQSLWETRESAGGKFLVRTGKEDLSELLSSVAQPSPVSRIKQLLASQKLPVKARQYVQFIERDLGELGFGYVLEASDTVARVLVAGNDDALEVPVVDIIQAADLEGEDSELAAIEIPAASADAKKLRDYFSQLFSQQPFFFEKLNKAIQDGTKF